MKVQFWHLICSAFVSIDNDTTVKTGKIGKDRGKSGKNRGDKNIALPSHPQTARHRRTLKLDQGRSVRILPQPDGWDYSQSPENIVKTINKWKKTVSDIKQKRINDYADRYAGGCYNPYTQKVYYKHYETSAQFKDNAVLEVQRMQNAFGVVTSGL